MVNRCDFSDLPTDTCAHCTGRTGDDDRRPLDSDVQSTWTARYSGRCDYCDGPIESRERMGRDHDGNYICWRCLP